MEFLTGMWGSPYFDEAGVPGFFQLWPALSAVFLRVLVLGSLEPKRPVIV